MNKIVLLIIYFSSTFLFSQEIELKEWAFNIYNDTIKQAVQIPHTWNAQDAFDDEPGYWRGKGFYTTQITISNTKKAYFLHFNGSNQLTKVWINNTYAGQHKGGYTAFDIDISEFLIIGENKIKVEVDNSHKESIPPLDADFTFYGGIYRSVYLVEENKVHFKKQDGADAIKIDALLDENEKGELIVKGAIVGLVKTSNYKVKINIRNLKNVLVVSTEETINHDFELRLELVKPALWSPKIPNLYSVELQLFEGDLLLDTYYHKIGFRKFETTTSGFKLNNQSLKLIGVNRHQDWEGLGNAVPISRQIQDLIMIKDMGSNFLRLAHYPQDKAIYKAADSLGLILWSEIPVVNKVPATDDYTEYKRNAIQMQQEHIAQNYNHPSLIFVGYMNEIFLRMVFDKDDKQTKVKIIENTLDLASDLESLTRKEAPHHTTVMALHGNQIYNETGIADISMVIGWNLYYGWYEGHNLDLGNFLDEEYKKYPNRPLIISEYGVGADQRLHNSNPKKFDFSEEYQFEYHSAYYKQIMERPFVVGMSAWNFADFGSEFRGDAMPHVNQKGLVNFNRTPKNIYYWYKIILNPEETVSMFFKGLANFISVSAIKEIKIISNQDVLLKTNKSGPIKLIPDKGIIHYKAHLKIGANRLALFDVSGKLLDSMIINYQKPDFGNSNTLAINFGTESYFIDSKNQTWIPSMELSILELSGQIKTQKSSTNIRNTFDDPLYQSSIHGVEKIKMDLPKGAYKITILLSNLKKDSKQIYELNKKENKSNGSNSGKKLRINGKEVIIEDMPPFSKQDIELSMNIQQGLTVESYGTKPFSICGILIKKE